MLMRVSVSVPVLRMLKRADPDSIIRSRDIVKFSNEGFPVVMVKMFELLNCELSLNTTVEEVE